MRIDVRTNAGQYALSLQAMAKEFGRQVDLAVKDVGGMLRQQAEWWSSGPIKLGYSRHVRTRAFDLTIRHPYSRLYGWRVGRGYPARINVQTGKFKAGWRTRSRKLGNRFAITLTNTSDRTRWLTARGTDRMVGRPVMEAIAASVEKKAAKRMLEAAGKSIGRRTVRSGGFYGRQGTLASAGLVQTFRSGYRMGSRAEDAAN